MNGFAMLGLWAAAAVVIAMVAGWGSLQAWLEAHEKLAAWVQAVGAIAAILAAGWIAAGQLRATREMAAHARRERIRALLEVIATLARLLVQEVDARAAFIEARKGDPGMVQFLSAGTPFADIETSASQIPVHELLDPRTVQLVFDLLRLARLARSVNSHLRDVFGTTEGVFLLGARPFGIVRNGLADLEAKCIEATQAVGAES